MLAQYLVQQACDPALHCKTLLVEAEAYLLEAVWVKILPQIILGVCSVYFCIQVLKSVQIS